MRDIGSVSPARREQYIRLSQTVMSEFGKKVSVRFRSRKERHRLLKVVALDASALIEKPKSEDAELSCIVLAIVSHNAAASAFRLWDDLEATLCADNVLGVDVSILPYTVSGVNIAVRERQPLISQLMATGVLLYEDAEPDRNGNPKHILRKPERWATRPALPEGPDERPHQLIAEQFFILGNKAMAAGMGWEANAAFQLHQATEFAFRSFAYRVGLIAPDTHSLLRLRRLVAKAGAEANDAWLAPADHQASVDMFCRAYAGARYDPDFRMPASDIYWQSGRVAKLLSLASSNDAPHLASLLLQAVRRDRFSEPIDNPCPTETGAPPEEQGHWERTATQFCRCAAYSAAQGSGWERMASFQLHQTAEACYRMVLVAHVGRAALTHNLGSLRRSAEAIDARLANAWETEERDDCFAFAHLTRAYIDARFAETFECEPELLHRQRTAVVRLLRKAIRASREAS